MVIVVNVRSWKRQLDGLEAYVKRLLLHMVASQPTHRFYLVSDEPFELEELPANASFLVLGPAGKQLLLQKYWLDVRLPLWLRKIKADVLVNPDGMASLTTRVPQCLLLPDLRFLQEPGAYSKTQRAFYKRQLPRSLQKARMVVLPSKALQAEVVTQYHLEDSKTAYLTYAVPDWFYPIDYNKKESIKASFAQGQEYFMYKGLVHDEYNLVNLLKAFSFFKKRQQSSWKLLLAGPFKAGRNTFQDQLMTYKYKEDVIVTGTLGPAEERELTGAAYALISPAVTETVNPAVWEAMQCEVPAMVASTATNKALFGDSVLFFDGNEPSDLAEWIMHLYRHEGERKVFIERGKQAVSGLSWEEAAASLWQTVLQAANT